MKWLARAPGFAYAVGEDVIVRPHDAALRCLAARPCALPLWTVARVIGHRREGAAWLYVLTFRHRGRPWLCIAPERAIDGTA